MRMGLTTNTIGDIINIVGGIIRIKGYKLENWMFELLKIQDSYE